MVKVAVIGAGSWGTALASVLSQNKLKSVLWARDDSVSDEVNAYHRNYKYLGESPIHEDLRATSSIEDAMSGADVVLVAVPSQAVRQVLLEVKPVLPSEAVVAHAVKGLDHATKRRISVLLREELGISDDRIAVITGPSHAEEVVLQKPTTIVVASSRRSTAEILQDALMNRFLRVYTNPDVIGAELGGCLKNIIALSVGVADGLGFGDNAKAALMTRGLAEMTRLGSAMGASPLTFAGLSGVGDLIVTCTSLHSRNFRAGRLIGQGHSLQDTLRQIGMAVEGIPTTSSALALATEHGVDMPITAVLHDVLFNGKNPAAAVGDLMGRARIHEMEEVVIPDLMRNWES